jgi:hypothetical protein
MSHKNQSEIVEILGCNNMRDLAIYINPSLGYVKEYIMFDSKYRILTESKNADILSFVWGYTGGQNVRIGSINSSSDIENIVCLKLQNFCMPYGKEFYDGLSSYSRISVVIDELSSQSYIVNKDKRAHWILKHDEFYSGLTKRIEFNIDDFSNGEYWFNKPITYLDNITVKIGSPTLPITFNYDRDTCTATYGNPTVITTTYPHGFFTGSPNTTYITMQNFTTNDVNADKTIISQMNSNTEILATVIDATNLSININTSGITPTPGLLFNVFFEDRRVIMHLEVTYKIS